MCLPLIGSFNIAEQVDSTPFIAPVQHAPLS